MNPTATTAVMRSCRRPSLPALSRALLLSLPAFTTLGCVTQDDTDEDGELAVSNDSAPLSADWAELPSARLTAEILPPLAPPAETGIETSFEAAHTLSSGSVETVGALSCSQHNDCRATSCMCSAGTCTVRPIGPLPPAGYCDLPPQRACTTANDCQSGCSCSGGACQAIPISPQNPSCHLPPPDDYEYDDVYASWSPYSGPQRHSFHRDGDTDWVAVYIAQPGLVRFRTHNLANQADTKLKVFAFDGLVKGALLGINDDIGGPYWWPESKSSRVDIQVPGDSTYLIKVVDRSPNNVYTDYLQFPEYTLTLSYL